MTERDDGSIEARLAVVSERWLERLLLRAGTDAEVIEPAKWRDLGRRAATAAAAALRLSGEGVRAEEVRQHRGGRASARASWWAVSGTP